MEQSKIIQLAKAAGATHKDNLGVYQFYSAELTKFVELVEAECAPETAHSKFYFDTDRNR